jgi:hypothetical protein
MIYLLAGIWFGRSAAIFAGLIFGFSPLTWFHGTVALTYIVEAFFSALGGYLCWRGRRDGREGSLFLILAAAVIGVAAGFRPSSLLFLGPLLIFSLRGARRTVVVGAAGIALLTLFAWFIPMVYPAGVNAYASSLVSLWSMVPSHRMVFNSSPWNSLARALLICAIFVLASGCVALLSLRRKRGLSPAERSVATFTGVWIAPGLLFFTFVYLKFVNSGYLLVLAPPAFAWMGLWASEWYRDLPLSRGAKLLSVAACAAVNTMVFLFAPVYCSYREVRRFEAELTAIVRLLPQIASPRDTMIVGFDSHFLGYRHAGYYLPDYLVFQFPEVHLPSGARAFAMQRRNTWLEGGSAPSFIHNFVLFPLEPGDSEAGNYMDAILRRFPPGELKIVSQGGYRFAIGSTAALGVLFPAADNTARNGPPRAR